MTDLEKLVSILCKMDCDFKKEKSSHNEDEVTVEFKSNSGVVSRFIFDDDGNAKRIC